MIMVIYKKIHFAIFTDLFHIFSRVFANLFQNGCQRKIPCKP